MLAELIPVLVPVFVTVGLGYGWRRRRLDFPTDFVARLVANLGVPCLVFSVLVDIEVSLAAIREMLLVALTAYGAYTAVGLLTLSAARLPLRTYLPAMMFPNTGNLGLAVCLFAFGKEGLAFGIIFFIVAVTAQFSAGVSIAAGRLSLHRVVREPAIYAVLIGLAFLGTGQAAPVWLFNTTELIGGITIPLMLFALGVSLAQLRGASVWRGAGLSAVRLITGFAIALALVELFALEGAARGAAIIQASMPVAVFNYLFALRYGNDPEDVASLVLISTVIALAALPLVLLVAMDGIGPF